MRRFGELARGLSLAGLVRCCGWVSLRKRRWGLVGRVASAAQRARVKARERRTALDASRAARDARIEAGAAAVFLAVADRDEARAAVARAEEAIGAGLRVVLAEGVGLGRAAQLCELRLAEVRRLAGRPTKDVEAAGEDRAAGEAAGGAAGS